MAAILPLIAFALAYGIFRVEGRGRRLSFLLGALVWGALVTVFTEALSLAGALAFGPLVVLWVVSCVVLALVFAWRRRPVPADVSRLWRWPKWPLALLWSTIAIVAVVGVTALVAPSNAHDGMSYHMPRVMHWIQNGTVAPYPTSNPRQTVFGPWAEYAILQMSVLFEGDRLANCVAWFAMAGTVALVSLLTTLLGGGVRAQLLATIFCATLPSAILHGATSLNDGVLAFWVLCFVCLVLLPHEEADGWWRAAALGLCAGLAVLTKPTAAFYLAPFACWVAWRWLARRRAHAVVSLAATAVVALAVAVPHYARNAVAYGSPAGPEPYIRSTLRMETHGPAALYSNVVRNLALHCALPSTRFNQYVTDRVVVALHAVVGLDPNDPRTTTARNEFGILPRMHEAIVGNLVHLVFLGWILWLVARRGWPRGGASRATSVAYVGCAVAGFLLFCLFVKWNPYLARLHLPFFVLTAPIAGIVLSRAVTVRTGYVCATVLLLSSLVWVFASRNRPIARQWNIFNTPRANQLFYDYTGDLPAWQREWLAAVERVKEGSCNDIGLLAGDSEMLEYQVWALLDETEHGRFRFEHVTSAEEPAYGEPVVPGFTPCVVVAFHTRGAATITVAGTEFARTFSSPEWALYEPLGPAH